MYHKNMRQFGACYFSLTVVAAVYTSQLRPYDPNKTANKKKTRKCKKEGIKNFLFFYYIQAKCGDINDKNPNAADDDERYFTCRWSQEMKICCYLLQFMFLCFFTASSVFEIPMNFKITKKFHLSQQPLTPISSSFDNKFFARMVFFQIWS